ncbi:C48 family peptidase [Bradyrhizobium barranii subsp. apii]|uniref:C48 family peptidase n=1 Tax=Bradyrhizobium barranii subsp. apii TaxID=2819348 RepID=A0A8T5UV09_9BRAD|nr:Ulp1 family isopeptidase [Bradyrhizobium barranii]UPT87680.1 C48 family peptidase [Bradyrhizobium barranii subsp. apii]
MPGASALQPGQSAEVYGTRRRPLYSQDADLILELEEAFIKGGAAERTAKENVGHLLRLGRWLFENKKQSIAARLDDESLTVDACEFFGKGNPTRLITAIGHLRTSQSTGGIVPIADRAKLNPYPQDAALIKEYKNEATTGTASTYAFALSSFSDYLRENNKKGIAARLSGKALDGDVGDYKKDAGGNRRIGAALTHLRKSSAGAMAMELERHISPFPDPERAALMEPRRVSDAAAEHSASQRAFSRPEELPAEGYDQDLVLGLMDEPGPSHSALQPAQSTGVLRRQRKQPLYSEDGPLISGLEKALIKGGATEITAKANVWPLRSFGRWLVANNKESIAARLNDESLTVDAREFFGKGNPTRLLTAIGHLRTSQSTGGIVPIADRAKLNPYPQDAALIKEYKNEAATGTAITYAFTLSSFSDYLRENNKPGIAVRLSGKALDGDVEDYKKDAGGNRRIGAALAYLRKSSAGAKAMELERHISPFPDPEDAALMETRRVGDAAAEHSASQEAGSWPEELLPAEAHDQDLLWGLMDEPGPSSSALQPARSTGVRRKQPLYSEDAPLISELEEALIKGGAAEATAKDYAGSLRRFGRWLFANDKKGIAARPDDESLTIDAREFIGKGDPAKLLAAIDHLRTSQSTGGIVPIAGRAKLNPYPQDVALIKEYKNKAATGTVRTYAVVLNSFSDYLRENNKKGIAARLSGKALDGDVESYRKDAGGNRNIGAALADLRKSQAGAKAMELERHISPGPDPENAVLMEPMPAGGAAAQHSASQDAGSWPKELLPVEGYDQDLLWELMDEPGPSSSLLEPAARHDQSSDPGESIRPLNWGYDRQQFPDEPIGALAKSNLLPSKEVLINDEHDTAELRPAKRPRTLDNLHGVAIERQLSEIVASGGRLLTSAPTHQLGASPWQAQPTMQGSGYQDATALQRAVSRPLVLPEGYDQDLRLMVEDGPPWPGVPPEQAQDIVQAGQQEPAWSASTWSPQMPLNFDWSMWPMLEASPAQAARARSSTYGGPPLVDLTAATPSESRDDVNSVPAFPSTSYDAQIGALGPTASPHGRGLVLEDTEWLGDEHVLRDYQLLAQELGGGDNPNLAARTRFVDPLITLVSLRLGTESEMLRAFQRIVHDQNGDDTADFLFLPVNNARATNLPGTHWSLLFVDRRDRERPVAYRYDSMGEYNNRPAAELAARLGARLESRGMTQQLNTYDCGVFVVDGTRALVRQLEQGRAPHLLNLSSLVANRQALQNRLRG